MDIGYKAWIRRKHQTATIGCLSEFGLLIFGMEKNNTILIELPYEVAQLLHVRSRGVSQ